MLNSIETFSLFLALIDDSLVSWTKFLADQGRTLVGQSQSPGRTSSSNRVSLVSPRARWTLLALMGISGGTYIGFKLPNQQG